MAKMHDLYRYFDADGRLLYVGRSLSAVTRAITHRGSAQWWEEMATMTVERFPEDQVCEAEREAIYYEKPIHNLQRPAPLSAAYQSRVDEHQPVGTMDSYPIKGAAISLGCSIERIYELIEEGSLRRHPQINPPSIVLDDLGILMTSVLGRDRIAS